MPTSSIATCTGAARRHTDTPSRRYLSSAVAARIQGILAAAVIVLAGVTPAGAATVLSGRVVAVIDGDTLTLREAGRRPQRIRLAAIDAPESDQPFGAQATQALAALCLGRYARVNATGRDHYGRVIGTVHCNDTHVNAELVRRGLAWVDRHHARRDAPLADLEQAARTARRGLWSEAAPIAPWAWRRAEQSPDDTQRAPPPSDKGGAIRGNRRSNIYHLPDCPSHDAVAPANRVSFRTEREAVAAGYRKAANCP